MLWGVWASEIRSAVDGAGFTSTPFTEGKFIAGQLRPFHEIFYTIWIYFAFFFKYHRYFFLPSKYHEIEN